MRGLTLAALILAPSAGCGFATVAAAQLYDSDWPAPALGEEPAFLHIEVRPDYWGDTAPQPHTLTFHMARGRWPSSDDEIPPRPVTAILKSHADGSSRIARSDSCPAILTVIRDLQAIEAPVVTPQELKPYAGGVMPIPPRVVHGATYQISLRAAVSNGNRIAMTLVDQSGDYAQWAGRAERALSECWTPVP